MTADADTQDVHRHSFNTCRNCGFRYGSVDDMNTGSPPVRAVGADDCFGKNAAQSSHRTAVWIIRDI